MADQTTVTCALLADALDDVLDGHGPWSAAAVDAHLGMCPSCRALVADVRAIRAAARTLEPIAPPPAVWAAVRARVAAATRARLAARSPGGVVRQLGRPAPARRGGRHAGAGGAPRSSGSGSRLGETPVPPVSGAGRAVNEFALAEAEYSDAIASLEQAAADAPRGLDEATNAALRASIDDIDSAIGEAREALAREPGDALVAGQPARRTGQQGHSAAGHGGAARRSRGRRGGTQPMTIVASRGGADDCAPDRGHRPGGGRAAAFRPCGRGGGGAGQGRQRSRTPRRDPPAARGAAPAAGRTAAASARSRAAGRWRRSSSRWVGKIGRQGALQPRQRVRQRDRSRAAAATDVRIEATKRVWDSTDGPRPRRAGATSQIEVTERTRCRGRPHRLSAPEPARRRGGLHDHGPGGGQRLGAHRLWRRDRDRRAGRAARRGGVGRHHGDVGRPGAIAANALGRRPARERREQRHHGVHARRTGDDPPAAGAVRRPADHRRRPRSSRTATRSALSAQSLTGRIELDRPAGALRPLLAAITVGRRAPVALRRRLRAGSRDGERHRAIRISDHARRSPRDAARGRPGVLVAVDEAAAAARASCAACPAMADRSSRCDRSAATSRSRGAESRPRRPRSGAMTPLTCGTSVAILSHMHSLRSDRVLRARRAVQVAGRAAHPASAWPARSTRRRACARPTRA